MNHFLYPKEEKKMGVEGVGERGVGGKVFLLYLVSHTHLGCSTALDVKMDGWTDLIAWYCAILFCQ